MRVTMREVAARAGVSLKTVSRVVNGEPHIRPDTEARVRAAIAELEWTPNAAARTLRTGRTGVVAIAVAELQRPLHAALVEALVIEAAAAGLQAAVEPTRDHPDRGEQILGEIGRTFDALIAVDAPRALVDGPGRAVVRVDTGRSPAVADCDLVRSDVDQAEALVRRHLEVMGRGRPLQLGAWPVLGSSAPYREVADTRAAGFAAGREVVAADADAVICSSDDIALGALAGLHAAGIDVPGDIAVLGFGALDDARFSLPPLTTVDVDLKQLARRAVELVVDRLARPGAPVRRQTVPVALLRRGSTLGAGTR